MTREGPTAFANVTEQPARSRWAAGAACCAATSPATRPTARTPRSRPSTRWIPTSSGWSSSAESARFGAEGLTGRGSFTYGESRPGGALKPLDLKSQSIVGNLEVLYPLHPLAQPATCNLAGGLDVIDQETKAGGFGLLSRDELRVALRPRRRRLPHRGGPSGRCC